MDGFEKAGLNEDNFGSANGGIVSAFDAFRTTPPSPPIVQHLPC